MKRNISFLGTLKFLGGDDHKMTIENDKTSYIWALFSISTTFSGAKTHRKDDVTRDDSKRRFSAQHSVTTLFRRCFEWLQHCSSISTLCSAKNSSCESSRLTSPYNDNGYYVFPPKSRWLTRVHSLVLRKSLPRWKGLSLLLTYSWIKSDDSSVSEDKVFSFCVFLSLDRKGIQLKFGDTISLDMYKVFLQILSQGVVWLAILLLILMSLLPDILFMLFGRHFNPSETQKVQVTMTAQLKKL